MSRLPKLRDFDDPTFDPFVAEDMLVGSVQDIYTPLAQALAEGPVHEGTHAALIEEGGRFLAEPGQRVFMVLGHEEIARAGADPLTFTNGPAMENNLRKTFGNTISAMDPPVHNRFRRIFQVAFLPQAIKSWSDSIVRPVVKMLLDPLMERGKADLIQDFTRFYPFEVIFRQLSLPQDEKTIFHKLAMSQTLVNHPDHIPFAVEASEKLGEYFGAMVEDRRANPAAHPADDLVGALINARVDGESLPDDVIVSFLRQLINAGGDTTYRATSCLLFGLLTNPDQLEAVKLDRDLIAPAIEEALRWEGPVVAMPRHAARDVTLGGVDIPAGSSVELVYGSGSRDPKVYDDPDRFDIFRESKRHFGFGHGRHLCIGLHLARMEITNALTAILDRMPNLRLDPDMPQPVITGRSLRYPRNLHVLFG